MFEVWACVSDAQYCHNEFGNMLLSAHIITYEYVVNYITSLFQKVTLLHNVLLSVNLAAKCIVTSLCNVLLLTAN